MGGNFPRRHVEAADERQAERNRPESADEKEQQRGQKAADQPREIDADPRMTRHQLVADRALAVFLPEVQAAEHGAEQISQQEQTEKAAVKPFPVVDRLPACRDDKDAHECDDGQRRQPEQPGAQETEQARRKQITHGFHLPPD